MAILQPSVASRIALAKLNEVIACPMPELAPVISAFFAANPFIAIPPKHTITSIALRSYAARPAQIYMTLGSDWDALSNF